VRIRPQGAAATRGALIRAYREAGLDAAAGWLDVELAGDEIAAIRKHDALPTPIDPLDAGTSAHVLLFENLFRDPDRPGNDRGDMACGTFQLASALTEAGHRITVVPGALSEATGLDDTARLDVVLAEDPPDLVGVTVLEACLPGVRALVGHLSQKTRALVVVGGPMVTWCPLHALAHLPGAHVAVRGDGEEVLPWLATLASGGLDDGAEQALLGQDGVVLIRDGRLVAGRLDRPARALLDRTPMRFDLLEDRHLQAGLSLETGRGCAHGCLFCTTPGRRDHRGRPGAVVARHLREYERRLASLYGADVPRIARRLQICDDDFTSDPGRAADVLAAVAESGLKLSAFQASVGDLLDRRSGEVREDLLDAIHPELYQDAAAFASSAPARGRLPAHTGAFVHLGIESFARGDLRRLGKGYSPEDAFAVVDALDRRGIVHDAYLILGNRGTTLDDLVESLMALCRLKIQHPHTFYLRLPVVPFVVPTFPSALYGAWSRQQERGEAAGEVELERILRLDGYPELDYPLVRREVPADLDAAAACEDWEAWIEPDARYEQPLVALREWLMRRIEGVHSEPRATRIRRAARRLASARERIVLGGVARARRNELRREVADRCWAEASELGLPDEVIPRVRNALEVGDPRLVVIPTRDCSLRCAYCPADKAPGLEMSPETMRRSVELLLSTDAPRAILQFFGGEALLRRQDVLATLDYGLERAAELGKELGFILSTNGLSLDPDLLSHLSRLPVKIEISLDGGPRVQNLHRRSADPAVDSYRAVIRHLDVLLASGIDHEVIMVVTPETVADLCDSFAHVVSLGFRRIQMNHGLAVMWSKEHKRALAEQLHAMEQRFFAGSLDAAGVEWIDLRSFRDPMLLNGETTVDHDGTVYHGNGFLIRSADAARFRAGHLDDLESFDAYTFARPDNAYLVRHTYPPDLARNNIEVGRIYGSFVQHMRRRFPQLAQPRPTRCPQPGGDRP